MPDSPLYTITDVRQRYGSREVLRVETAHIAEGTILALVGPSGAGKSTLLRLLNFLETPSSGTIAFRGEVYGPEPPLAVRRAITTVFQRPVLLSGTTLDNVLYGLRLRGIRDAAPRAMQTLRALGLAPLATKAASTLSGGELQRMALARAMVLDPPVMLLDEPTANLDPANVQMIEQAIVRRHREQGTTIVLVTHNLFQARRLSTHVAVLLDGQIADMGPTERVFSAPANARTQAFLNGDMVY